MGRNVSTGVSARKGIRKQTHQEASFVPFPSSFSPTPSPSSASSLSVDSKLGQSFWIPQLVLALCNGMVLVLLHVGWIRTWIAFCMFGVVRVVTVWFSHQSEYPRSHQWWYLDGYVVLLLILTSLDMPRELYIIQFIFVFTILLHQYSTTTQYLYQQLIKQPKREPIPIKDIQVHSLNTNHMGQLQTTLSANAAAVSVSSFSVLPIQLPSFIFILLGLTLLFVVHCASELHQRRADVCSDHEGMDLISYLQEEYPDDLSIHNDIPSPLYKALEALDHEKVQSHLLLMFKHDAKNIQNYRLDLKSIDGIMTRVLHVTVLSSMIPIWAHHAQKHSWLRIHKYEENTSVEYHTHTKANDEDKHNNGEDVDIFHGGQQSRPPRPKQPAMLTGDICGSGTAGGLWQLIPPNTGIRAYYTLTAYHVICRWHTFPGHKYFTQCLQQSDHCIQPEIRHPIPTNSTRTIACMYRDQEEDAAICQLQLEDAGLDVFLTNHIVMENDHRSTVKFVRKDLMHHYKAVYERIQRSSVFREQICLHLYGNSSGIVQEGTYIGQTSSTVEYHLESNHGDSGGIVYFVVRNNNNNTTTLLPWAIHNGRRRSEFLEKTDPNQPSPRVSYGTLLVHIFCTNQKLQQMEFVASLAH